MNVFVRELSGYVTDNTKEQWCSLRTIALRRKGAYGQAEEHALSSYNPHVDAPPIRARYTGRCACCKANYSPGRIIYYSTAREGWVIAMPHDSAGLRVETDDKPERKQPLVKRSRLAKPLRSVCGVCVLDVEECECRKDEQR